MAASAAVGLIAPYSPLVYSAPLLAPYGHNYRGPLSLAPGQPANVLAADGRPLDTLDVNLDRSAHFISKAYAGAHLLKKRSIAVAPLVAPVPAARVAYAAPYVSSLGYTRVASVTPYGHLGIAAPYYAHW